MPVPQKWIDTQAEPFEGCLIILNIGKDNYDSLKICGEYYDNVVEAIKHAHAKGFAVLYLGDVKHGTMEPPEDLPALAGADVSRLMGHACGLQLAEFPAEPNARMAIFGEIARLLFERGRQGALLPLTFTKDAYANGRWRICGNCTLDGEQVLHPVVEIQLGHKVRK